MLTYNCTINKYTKLIPYELHYNYTIRKRAYFIFSEEKEALQKQIEDLRIQNKLERVGTYTITKISIFLLNPLHLSKIMI